MHGTAFGIVVAGAVTEGVGRQSTFAALIRQRQDTAEIVELLSSIGFDFEKGSEAIRIFGYAPRARDEFVP